MQKDFDAWNEKKKQIDSRQLDFSFREGDVHWAHLGLNIGHEENGKGRTARRPILILKKFSNNLAYVVPVTTQFKDTPYYLPFVRRIPGKNYSLLECVMLSQAKAMSSKRFDIKIGWVEQKELERIKEALKATL